MFSLTPIEASLWALGVRAQTYIAQELLGGFGFLTVAVTFLAYFLYRTLFQYSQEEQPGMLGKRVVEYLCYFGFGLMCLRMIATDPFMPTDSSERAWGSHFYVVSNPQYGALKDPAEGLLWYRRLHGATVQLSSFMTDMVSGIFGDRNYRRSPNMMFKMLVNTANVQLDDPNITTNLDKLAAQCSDTDEAIVLEKDAPLATLFTMDKPECRQAYNDLRRDLKRWARMIMPDYLKKVSSASPGELSDNVRKFSKRNLLENKMIASALNNYVKTMANTKRDHINTNYNELGLRDYWDRFYFNMQRSIAGGSAFSTVASAFTDSDVEGTLVKNEAGIIYNNLLNLLPSIKGYLKIFIALSFLVAAGALACGFLKPAIWWVRICCLEMLYEPLSALNYEIHSVLVASTNVEKAFGTLISDPLVLMGASIIDSELVKYQTTFFMTQLVIAALFVVGVIQAGFAVRSMSFAQGAAIGGFTSMITNNRLMHGAMGRIGSAGAAVGSRAFNAVSSRIGRR